MDIIIRDGKGRDWIAIKGIQEKVCTDTYPNEKFGVTKEAIREKFERRREKEKADLEKMIKNFGPKEDSHYWVAETEGKIVGYVGTHIKDGERRLGALYILPEYQRIGIGSKLFNKAVEWIGTDNFEIEVAAYNEKAINFYNKFGYELTGKNEEFPIIDDVKIPVAFLKKSK
jgi:ribosomal protein S18 acetylase RimI-like enzyme